MMNKCPDCDGPKPPTHTCCSKCRTRRWRAAHPETAETRRAYARQRRADNLEEARAANRRYTWLRLLETYGLTEGQYDAMYEAQGGVCGICAEPENKRKLAVDHDHETGRVRGLLCQRCNRGLGLFRDNTTFLKRAVIWLDD